MKLIVVFVLLASAYGQLPDAPSTIKPSQLETAQKKQSGEVRVIKTDRLFNKKFIFSSAALFGSMIYDAEVSHAGIQKGNCVEFYGEPRASKAQLYGRMLPIDAGIWGLALLLRRGHVPVAPYSTLLIGAGRHFYVGSEWFTHSCL